MLAESKALIANLDRYFLRRYQWRYHILIVDNHLFNCYSFFLQAQRGGERLIHSYDLLEIPHRVALYQEVCHDLQAHSALSIEYRDTHHLVHPGADIVQDLAHGHYKNTHYHDAQNRN
ncbi:hypothetical protein [Lactiplantibacillus fabifermentans]|uniref:Uncharacterized protein n=2 Tax=Lactiplantibacillus fabifermentans TaxID=483011 RepID=A0A0R2NUD7_9LACO|nr:hypothetical protein [Lactiplantibacillus fabifermentans]ETY74369.1 hypothetical protein LFAB_07855 [Lactiplantibacillus fabifermentans T30PCM01]KRO28267.1 hypothetical protein DY78_GL002504 [Lactiplantibacillus fabifermentans DSM 21115]